MGVDGQVLHRCGLSNNKHNNNNDSNDKNNAMNNNANVNTKGESRGRDFEFGTSKHNTRDRTASQVHRVACAETLRRDCCYSLRRSHEEGFLQSSSSSLFLLFVLPVISCLSLLTACFQAWAWSAGLFLRRGGARRSASDRPLTCRAERFGLRCWVWLLGGNRASEGTEVASMTVFTARSRINSRLVNPNDGITVRTEKKEQ